jgi:translation initiation factor 1
MGKDGRDLVWSSEGGDACPACGRPREACTCAAAPPRSAGDGTVRVGRETKGRRGKAVTVVRGLSLGAGELDDLARELKRLCGTGGTVKDGVIEIQGDQRDRVVAALADRGFRVKRAGG